MWSRWSTVVRSVAPLLSVFAIASPVLGDDLTGHVVDAKGAPLAGATVLVNTAAPRVGVSVYCPSCYADCGKKATTDADGQFVIHELDPALVFYLVAAAEGHRAGNSEKVDASSDKPTLRLAPLPAKIDPDHVVRGRVVDEAGKPVVGAQVAPKGRKQGDIRMWGLIRSIDPFAVTDERGEFLLTATDAADAYDLTIRSPKHAAKSFPLVPTGDEIHELAVEPGALVRGQLLDGGKPIAGAAVGLVQVDRSSDGFLGEHEIGTRADGSFEFSYIPDQDDYYLYTKMSSLAQSVALPLRRVTIADAQPIVELGELEVGPAVTIAGRIELVDGKLVPGPLQLLLSREGAWDSQTATIGSDGKFIFENVPNEEPLRLTARVPGYRLASERNRFQQIDDDSIAFFVEAPRDDVVIYFESAPRDTPGK
jgi:uncharacterized GH25 family protein